MEDQKIDLSRGVKGGVLPPFFYFSALPDSGLVRENDPGSLKFLILQNDHFHRKIEEQNKRIAELESSNQELEDSNSRIERQKVLLRGYLKNMNAMCELYGLLDDYHQTRHRFYCRYILFQKVYITLGILSLLLFCFLSFYQATPVALALISSIVYHYRTNSNKDSIKSMNRMIGEKRKEIAEIKKSNDLLDQL